MNNIIKIRKIGKFYNVFDDDCYILYYLFNYKIKQSRTGFPISAYNKVINKLEELCIDYEVLGETKVSFKNKNSYNKYLNRGIEKYKIELNKINLEDRLEKLSEKDLKNLYKLIEEYVCAREFSNS